MKLGNIFNMSPVVWLTIQSKVELIEIGKQSGADYQKYRLTDLLKKVG